MRVHLHLCSLMHGLLLCLSDLCTASALHVIHIWSKYSTNTKIIFFVLLFPSVCVHIILAVLYLVN